MSDAISRLGKTALQIERELIQRAEAAEARATAAEQRAEAAVAALDAPCDPGCDSKRYGPCNCDWIRVENARNILAATVVEGQADATA